jgi:dipeptidase E
MKRIIGIGGGEISKNETFKIDKYIVESTNIEHPKLLFIPTASYDAESYIKAIKIQFEKRLKCIVDTLELTRVPYSDTEIRNKILNADIIYVGGGNTKNMLKVWREKKVDIYLREAYENEILMTGLSAGSICWFAHGHSDSDTIASGEEQPFSIVDAMGWFPLFECPHHNEERRAPDFDTKIIQTGYTGLGLENCSAIEIVDDTFRILKSNDHAKAYKVSVKNASTIREELISDEKYRSIDELLS